MGKGVIKHIRSLYPMANIAAIDYDPGASEVNQLNRIKLMLATAGKNAARKEEEAAKSSGSDGKTGRTSGNRKLFAGRKRSSRSKGLSLFR